jgi:hypothetical protein
MLWARQLPPIFSVVSLMAATYLAFRRRALCFTRETLIVVPSGEIFLTQLLLRHTI